MKKIIEVTKNEFIKNLKYNDDHLKVVEKMKANNIKIFLGLKLPGLKMHIESIIQKVKTLKINYKRNERNFRNNRSLENEDAYTSNLKKYNELTLNEILNIDLFKIILSRIDDEDLFYDLLLEDYYTIFIGKNLKMDNDKNFINLLKKVLKLFCSLRSKEEYGIEQENRLECLANTINWVESFSDEIIIILKVFYKLNRIIDNLFDKIEFKLNNVYNDTKNDNAILIMIDSILSFVTDVQIYKDKEKDYKAFFLLLNNNKEILNQILPININLCLNSKEVFCLQEQMKVS